MAAMRGITAQVQDRMASVLLLDAGYREFRNGALGADAFMDRLARIWAGLPLKSGKSAYHGHAGNRATISRAFYAKQVKAIFEAGLKVWHPMEAKAPADPVGAFSFVQSWVVSCGHPGDRCLWTITDDSGASGRR